MKRCVSIKSLVNGRKLKGEIVILSRPKNTGIIQGDDGYDVGFHAVSVFGAAYRDLCVGDRVIFELSFSRNAKIPAAVNVQLDRRSEKQAEEPADGVDCAG